MAFGTTEEQFKEMIEQAEKALDRKLTEEEIQALKKIGE